MLPDRRVTYFIYARILVSFLFLGLTILFQSYETSSAEYAFPTGIIRLMAFSCLFSILSYFLLKIPKLRFFITYLQSIWDVLFVTVLLLFTGGMTSPYSFLYLLSIMNAGLLLGRREALYTASLCGILYGALADFHFFGLLESIGLHAQDAQRGGAANLFYTIFFNLIGYGLAAFITGYLAEQARQSEAALHEKCVDFDELAQLNSLIVSNLETGLLTVTNNGRVRVFNPYLEQLTGLSQVVAYDRHLADIFPALGESFPESQEGGNGEIVYEEAGGKRLLLSHAATPFSDAEGKPAGYIVTLRDMTDLHRMEEALKKRDRMAVLGELSARMAHEIRNPLAAMSGSVQMLAEQDNQTHYDRRLLDIVLRESERLNTLITDFLVYARPLKPLKRQLELALLIADIFFLIAADPRYQKLCLRHSVATTLTIRADEAQLRQVLFNLLYNAADAMPEGGTVDVDARYCLSGADGFGAAPIVLITVRDQGIGMTPEILSHLFEPFYTTKPQGTGLGLATTYRIIDAHGGTIQFETAAAGGCVCSIMLPV